VAVAGSVVALTACLAAPFVALRPNAIASGTPERLAVAGPAGLALVALALAALALAVAPRGPRADLALKTCTSAAYAALAFALGAAARLLLTGAPASAGVSLASGAWFALVGVIVADFAARRRRPPRAAVLGLDALALGALALALAFGGLAQLSVVRAYSADPAGFWSLVEQHLFLSGTSLLAAIAIGLPLGIWSARSKIVSRIALGVVGIVQTIPSLAMLGLLIAPLAALRAASPLLASLGVAGIGATPAIIALTLYALLPIVRNTYVGLTSVDPAAVDVGVGMGMSRGQVLARVELPLAMPLVFEGVRVAAVIVIGIASVTAFIGAGGLGKLIFIGLGQLSDDLVLLGALPVIALAVAADAGIRVLSRRAVSPGIRVAEEGGRS
jgi:osmoprotectant transport system permease protein